MRISLANFAGCLALLSLGLGGCQRFTRSFHDVAWKCSLPDENVLASTSFVKILNPEHDELKGLELATTRARFIGRDGVIKPLELTAKACVALPPEAGLLQVYNINPGLHLSVAYSARPEQGGLETVSLQKQPEVNAQLICSDEGYFVHEVLPFPARLITSGSLHSTQIRVVAVPNPSGVETELFRKDYGTDQSSWPSDLLTKNLPEGTYNIRLDVVQNNRGWDVPLALQSAELCPLRVLHRKPGVRGLQLVNALPTVVQKNDILPWSSDNEFGRLFICRENKAQDADDIGGEMEDSCDPQAECQNLDHFKTFSQLTATDAGVFDYFVYAQDRSGHRSDLSCQRMIVSDQKPKIDVRWTEESWNQPVGVMARPKAGFAATIAVSHPQRGDRSLAENLQCRVDFMVDTSTSMAGHDVLCTAGRCKGQRMEQFVPCDTRIEGSLSEFWANQIARPLLMRLHVRADDGSGRFAETIRSVWIHPQRWQPETMPVYPTIASSDQVNSLVKDRHGQLFTVYGVSSAIWDRTKQSWTVLPTPFSQRFKELKVFAANGEVYLTGLLTTSQRVQTPNASIARWDGQAWQLLPVYAGTSECFFSQQSHDVNGFWCKANDAKAIHYAEGHWEDIEFPKDETGKACYAWGLPDANRTIFAEKEGGYWMLCYEPGILYHRNAEGVWDEKSYALKGLIAIVRDAKGRIWTLQTEYQGFKMVRTLGYVEQGVWQAVESPEPQTFANPNLTPTPDGGVLYYDMRWSDEDQRWERLAGLDAIWPQTHLSAMYADDQHLVLISGSGFSRWEAGEITHYPISWFDLDVNGVAGTILFDQDDDVWFRAPLQRANEWRLRRMHVRPWNSFGVDTGLFQRSESSINGGVWFDAAGFPTTLVARKGLYQASDEGWKPLFATEETFWISGRDHMGSYFMSGARDIYRWNNGKYDLVVPSSDASNAYTFIASQTSKGRVWGMRSGTNAVWRLGLGEPEPFFLPDQVAVSEMGELLGQWVVWTAAGVFRFDEETLQWLPVQYEDLGLPALTKRALTVSVQQTLVQLEDSSWILRGTSPAQDVVIKPPFAESWLGPQQLIILGPLDYLLFVQDRGMYRGDGQNWKPLLTDRDVMRLMPGVGQPYFSPAYLDPLGRVWLTGKPFRLLMYDLKAL